MKLSRFKNDLFLFAIDSTIKRITADGRETEIILSLFI